MASFLIHSLQPEQQGKQAGCKRAGDIQSGGSPLTMDLGGNLERSCLEVIGDRE